MKVLTRNFAFLFLFFAARKVFADHSSEEYNSSEEGNSDEVTEIKWKELESRCNGDQSNTIYLGGYEDSSAYYTVGKHGEELDDCYIELRAPDLDYGVVMVVEKYNTQENRALAPSQSGDCKSTVKVTYKKEGEDQESSMCVNSKRATEARSVGSSTTEPDVDYTVWSTTDNVMKVRINNPGEEMYGMVVTAVRKGDDCGEDTEWFACVGDDTDGFKQHCIWKDFACNGHVNCAVTPQPTDEASCPGRNTTFEGVTSDQYLYYHWTSSVLIFALIVIPVTALVLIGLVLLFMCIRKMMRRHQQRAMAEQAAHVNVIVVPEWEKDEKLNKPPDYNSIEELPPAYHSLFLPTSTMMQNDEPIEKQMHPITEEKDKTVVFSSYLPEKSNEYNHTEA